LIRFFLLIFSLFLLLEARENPFFPTVGEQDIPITSNEDRTLPSLKRATLTFPPEARTIQKVTVEYKNLDGSISKKSIVLQNSIDWHLPLFISQNYTLQNNSKKIKNYTNSKKKSRVFKKIAGNREVKFSILSKSLKVLTKDKMIRNFLLVNPHRIVMDFKKDISTKSYIKKFPKSIFKKIRIGNHSGYYRVVVELDGYYRYKLKKEKSAYIFTLR